MNSTKKIYILFVLHHDVPIIKSLLSSDSFSNRTIHSFHSGKYASRYELELSEEDVTLLKLTLGEDCYIVEKSIVDATNIVSSKL